MHQQQYPSRADSRRRCNLHAGTSPPDYFSDDRLVRPQACTFGVGDRLEPPPVGSSRAYPSAEFHLETAPRSNAGRITGAIARNVLSIIFRQARSVFESRIRRVAGRPTGGHARTQTRAPRYEETRHIKRTRAARAIPSRTIHSYEELAETSDERARRSPGWGLVYTRDAGKARPAEQRVAEARA